MENRRNNSPNFSNDRDQRGLRGAPQRRSSQNEERFKSLADDDSDYRGFDENGNPDRHFIRQYKFDRGDWDFALGRMEQDDESASDQPDNEYSRAGDPDPSDVRNYVGKGPKNYKRSDERILDEVCLALYVHPRIDASEIEVSVKDGVVTLLGTVSERPIKRLVEDVVEKCSGVTDVSNQIKVQG